MFLVCMQLLRGTCYAGIDQINNKGHHCYYTQHHWYKALLVRRKLFHVFIIAHSRRFVYYNEYITILISGQYRI